MYRGVTLARESASITEAPPPIVFTCPIIIVSALRFTWIG